MLNQNRSIHKKYLPNYSTHIWNNYNSFQNTIAIKAKI